MPQLPAAYKPGPGRPKGSQNQATKDFKEFWGKVFADPRYLRNLLKRMYRGQANHMESYIAALLYGKPKEVFALEDADGRPLRGVVVYIPDNQRSTQGSGSTPTDGSGSSPEAPIDVIVCEEPKGHGNGNGAG